MNQPKHPVRPAMRRRDYLSAATIAACLIALVIPYLMPVVVLDRAEGVTRLPDGEVRAHLSGIKVRACPPLAGSFVGWALTPDGWREVGFEWVDDLSPDSPRPVGYLAAIRACALVWRKPGGNNGAGYCAAYLRGA